MILLMSKPKGQLERSVILEECAELLRSENWHVAKNRDELEDLARSIGMNYGIDESPYQRT